MEQDIIDGLKLKKDQVLEQWLKDQAEASDYSNNFNTNEELEGQSAELVDILLSTLNEDTLNNFSSGDLEPLTDYISSLTISRARQGFSPRETATYIFTLKDALIKVLGEIVAGEPTKLYSVTLKISKFIDNIGILSFETFITGREDVISQQSDEMAELSTPVIRVWNGILAMPIIGTLDSARTQIVMENLLQGIVDTGSSIAILDISGVPAVDSLVAQHLIKTVNATRLMGAECIISGIRPEIAQTVVHLGIDLSQMITKATLESALKYAFNTLQLEVRRIDKNKAN
ncbi:STAS domain-containing protein [Dyadobacter psychrotolerans]|uniref:STAS domain-containing protein n=1 Tax=Dyadobacter psychrotolerans TaxID=2541721 RepID=A0A4R5DMT8_9BACT|nr:STAS domain-containing protein [Dyadobacter psychrotolerans]TDE15616.1 STAS domain-containing protein [Dyadobacter psychrotolerans]